MIDENLLAEVRDRAPGIESARRLPADLAAKMATAGWFRAMMPRAYGGDQLPAAEAFSLIESVAHADAASGWCVMISATSTLALAYLPESEARAIAHPMLIMCGVFAPIGRATLDGDAYRVTGTWPWGSNSPNSDWLMGGCVIVENGDVVRAPGGHPEARMMLFRADQVSLGDTWHATGLKGTGSGEIQVRDARVPASRSLSLTRDQPLIEAPLYAFPAFGMLAVGIASVAIGNARAAIDDVIALSSTKKPQASARTLGGHAYAQSEVAKADANLRSARAFLYEAIGGAWDEAATGAPIAIASRARLRLAATHATRTAAEVVTAMYQLAGGTAVFLASPLQRRLRDAHVATQHMMVSPATYELTGRVLLGIETDASFL